MIRSVLLCCSTVSLLLFLSPVFADGPADNQADSVREIPPIGEALGQTHREQLANRCQEIRQEWGQVIAGAKEKATQGNQWQKTKAREELLALESLTSEILVFPRAVELAIEFQQFYRDAEIDQAIELLDEAERRIHSALESPQWETVVGIKASESRQLVVGGFQSKIDGSFQPYAIVIPAGFSPGDSRLRRLDLWFHGRGEKLSEVSFLSKGRTNAGQYTPADTFVLHPYGRYTNAFKFAGEIDVLEALEHVKKRLAVDHHLISARGFSMGGAACWQFATHYADRFFAANPGAGFSETPEFLKSFQGEDLSDIPDYQRRLWRLYDCPPWARNLIHCPTVAYSGEIDRQKQAADVMTAALASNDIELTHIIGPDTAHQIHADSKVEIERRMSLLAQTTPRTTPRSLDFTTYTLRYNRMHWVRVHGMSQHWEKATVNAEIKSRSEQVEIAVKTRNVTEIELCFDPGQWQERYPTHPLVVIDGDLIAGPPVKSDLSWSLRLSRRDGEWTVFREGQQHDDLAKRPGLQGPVDDAFLSSFVFVAPSEECRDAQLNDWVTDELNHAMLHWRKHFRGDVRQVRDGDVTEDMIENSNLILFGDPSSNSVIRKIADRLPFKWTNDSIELGKKQFDRPGHAVIGIYPNPLNPKRYIVLNSGFTFREYDYLNNARQTPKLPDWAIVDVTRGANFRDPGKIKAAGFFDESWQP